MTTCSHSLTITALLYFITVEPPNKGHFGNGSFVLSSEVVPISEVHHILIYIYIISKMFKMGR